MKLQLTRPLARPSLALLPFAAALALAACSVGPGYQRPSAASPAGYREAPAADAGWFPAAPADALDRGPWWQLFGDADLSALIDQVEVSNQNVAAAVAAYAQARALVAQQRASLFPTVGVSGSATRSGGNGSANSDGSGTSNRFQAALGASWEPDIWGKLRLSVQGAQASAQASDAELAAARLSAQSEVATNYFSLREADAEIALVRDTIEGYRRALTITQNRYDAAIAARTDVLQAQTALANAQADLSSLVNQRAQSEHAIAVLVGKAPGDFSVPVKAWNTSVPALPLFVPSELLQRRPDISSAERQVAAANAQIGIDRAAYFPSIPLTASFGNSASRLGDLFNASTTLWSLGLSITEGIFDAGARRAAVQGAEAFRDAAVARYRQSVLVAFQSVEDQLSSARALNEQAALRRTASEAADLTEQQLLNQYKSGLVAYTNVVTAQASALSARRTLAQVAVNRQSATVGLIVALGGGWHAPADSDAAAAK